MPAPGTILTDRARPPARAALTDTSTLFLVGPTASGTAETPTKLRDISDYTTAFGARTGAGIPTYDYLDAFFREYGGTVWFAKLTSASTKYQDALATFTDELGPGQVAAIGAETAALHTHLLEHAALLNRHALLDCALADTAEATLTAIATTDSADPNASYGELFAPWASIPAIPGGSARDVPYSAIQAAILSRNDKAGVVQNQPSAGVWGISTYALDVETVFTDDERETLNDAGVNVARLIHGTVRTYGCRTLAPDTDAYTLGSNSRLRMAIFAQAEVIAESYVFAQIDGRRVKINEYGAQLSALLARFYEAGALYGDTARDAFRVDVGATVNTDETIAANELHAVMLCRMSPFAELVQIDLVKVAITDTVA